MSVAFSRCIAILLSLVLLSGEAQAFSGSPLTLFPSPENQFSATSFGVSSVAISEAAVPAALCSFLASFNVAAKVRAFKADLHLWFQMPSGPGPSDRVVARTRALLPYAGGIQLEALPESLAATMDPALARIPHLEQVDLTGDLFYELSKYVPGLAQMQVVLLPAPYIDAVSRVVAHVEIENGTIFLSQPFWETLSDGGRFPDGAMHAFMRYLLFAQTHPHWHAVRSHPVLGPLLRPWIDFYQKLIYWRPAASRWVGNAMEFLEAAPADPTLDPKVLPVLQTIEGLIDRVRSRLPNNGEAVHIAGLVRSMSPAARRLTWLMNYLLELPETPQDDAFIRSVLDDVGHHVLPQLGELGDPAFWTLPMADDWLVVPLLPDVKDTEALHRRSKRASRISVRASAMGLGLLGLHRRREYFEKFDAVDNKMTQAFLPPVLRRLGVLMNGSDVSGASESEEGRRLVQAVVSNFVFDALDMEEVFELQRAWLQSDGELVYQEVLRAAWETFTPEFLEELPAIASRAFWYIANVDLHQLLELNDVRENKISLYDLATDPESQERYAAIAEIREGPYLPTPPSQEVYDHFRQLVFTAS